MFFKVMLLHSPILKLTFLSAFKIHLLAEIHYEDAGMRFTTMSGAKQFSFRCFVHVLPLHHLADLSISVILTFEERF